LIKKDFKKDNTSKVDIFISNWIEKYSNQDSIKRFYSKYNIPNFDDDIIGAFYQSIQSISRKSNTGSYYTPSKLLKDISVKPNMNILDPCCGSGGILLNVLTKKHDTSKIFARDIDDIALKICFVNLVLFFNDKNIFCNISKQDISKIKNDDLFFNDENKLFDFIITNPPWGSKFSKQQKYSLLSLYPELETTEIFSISLYNSIKMLKKDGEL